MGLRNIVYRKNSHEQHNDIGSFIISLSVFTLVFVRSFNIIVQEVMQKTVVYETTLNDTKIFQLQITSRKHNFQTSNNFETTINDFETRSLNVIMEYFDLVSTFPLQLYRDVRLILVKNGETMSKGGLYLNWTVKSLTEKNHKG